MPARCPGLRSSIHQIWTVFFIACTVLVSAHAAPLPPPTIPAQVQPWDNVVAYAAAHNLSVKGIEPLRMESEGKAGDAMTILLTFSQDKLERQWLIELRESVLSEKEKAAHPPVTNTIVVDGAPLQFGPSPRVVLDLRVVGPFTRNGKDSPTEKRGRIFFSTELLRIGLDGACRIAVATTAASKRPGAKNLPPPKATEAEKREIFGAWLALFDFLQGVLSDNDLAMLLWQVADKPSVFSLIKHAGKINANFSNNGEIAKIDSADWGEASSTIYSWPVFVTVYDKPCLRCIMVAGPSRPPFTQTAGIVALAAESATTENRRVEMRVIAAHLATR